MLDPDIWLDGKPLYLDVGKYDDLVTDWIKDYLITDEVVGIFNREVKV
jgi:hypothetical protein